jgi:hypothetical protein
MNLTDVLPVTALVAISIFIIKEIVEAIRRKNADRRKLGAIKLTVAEELQRNAFCHRTLVKLLARMVDESANEINWSSAKDVEGKVYVLASYKDGSLASRTWLPKTSSLTYQKIYLEAAALDKNLFDTLSKAYDCVSEMEHIRGSMLDYISDREDFFPGLVEFARWAIESLEDIEAGMQEAHLFCAGNREIPIKLR